MKKAEIGEIVKIVKSKSNAEVNVDHLIGKTFKVTGYSGENQVEVDNEDEDFVLFFHEEYEIVDKHNPTYEELQSEIEELKEENEQLNNQVEEQAERIRSLESALCAFEYRG